jgi:hypothetical protein
LVVPPPYTDWFDIGVGVRQGCVLSPLLFDLFIDSMAREAKALGLGVDFGGQRLAILLYADDVVLLANSPEDLQKLLDAVAAFFRRWRLEINLSKTKVMAFGVRALGSVQVRWGGATVEEVDEYKYLGLILEKSGKWKKEKARMLRKATMMAGMAWGMVLRVGNMSVKGMDGMWKALIRPHLEYGAEVMNSHKDFVWEEAEKLMRDNGRRLLGCGSRVPNEAVMGELGWVSMIGRRMLLRLLFWGKILSMDKDRLVKQVYEAGRARLARNQNANTWCNLTRKWLRQLGLEAMWNAQAVDEDWRETLKGRIMVAEGERWRRGAERNARLENYRKWKPMLALGVEHYLEEQCRNRRRLWTKLRAGCLELRIETGRWERVTVAGAQELVPRWARMCPLCFEEVEDVAHVLFRCPTYSKLRAQFLRESGLAGATRHAAQEAFSGVRGREEEVCMWLMSTAGVQRGMCFLEQVMRERALLIG